MSLDILINEIIRDAMAQGEFDRLPCARKPLDHDACFALPEDRRLTFTVLKNAGYVPEEVDLL
jgi:DnaJ homologue, subfamily C, member 28, conserved domain